MTEVTRILNQIEDGDPSASEQLLPLVYDELRTLAAQRLAHKKPGQTLQATALVHEAFIRLARAADSVSFLFDVQQRLTAGLPYGTEHYH